jgi:hypothetical protein
MPRYEYKLVPAPEKSAKHKGLKGAALFAATLEELLNGFGADGWQYVRAEILPEEVRSGLTSRTTVYRNLLIFRRSLPENATSVDETGHHTLAQSDQEPSLANLFLDPEDQTEPNRSTATKP